jgi:hypothetical protein
MTLTEDQIKQLDAFIQEMPTKFGLPLLNFLNKIAQEQNPDSVQIVEEK